MGYSRRQRYVNGMFPGQEVDRNGNNVYTLPY